MNISTWCPGEWRHDVNRGGMGDEQRSGGSVYCTIAEEIERHRHVRISPLKYRKINAKTNLLKKKHKKWREPFMRAGRLRWR